MVLGIFQIIVPILLGGFLWRLGGSDYAPKAVRRLGVAGVLTIAMIFGITLEFPLVNIWLALLFVPATFGIAFGTFTMPYGVPDPPTHPCPDEGSFLGRFFYNLFRLYPEEKRRIYTDICVRGICGLMYSLSYLPSIIYQGAYWKIILMAIPTILIPIIVISKADEISGWLEEFLIGCAITLGMIIIWIR